MSLGARLASLLYSPDETRTQNSHSPFQGFFPQYTKGFIAQVELYSQILYNTREGIEKLGLLWRPPRV